MITTTTATASTPCVTCGEQPEHPSHGGRDSHAYDVREQQVLAVEEVRPGDRNVGDGRVVERVEADSIDAPGGARYSLTVLYYTDGKRRAVRNGTRMIVERPAPADEPRALNLDLIAQA